MIWIFDSWFWWLQTLKYVSEAFPHENFLFLADSAYVPYGDKSKEEIKERTTRCVEYLFDQWCHHVLIACNTAVAAIHEHWFLLDTERRLIWVTRSGIKQLIRHSFSNIAVFCTQATHNLRIYQNIYAELGGTGTISSVPLPELVPLIEAWADKEILSSYIDKHKHLISKDIDSLILWCTHYPLLVDLFREKFPYQHIIDPGRSSIYTIRKRLLTKSEMNLSGLPGTTQILCTWDLDTFIWWAEKIIPWCSKKFEFSVCTDLTPKRTWSLFDRTPLLQPEQ
jgi:glutamate racemase